MKGKKAQADPLIVLIVFVIFAIAGGIIWFFMSSITTELKADPDLAGHIAPIVQAEQSFGILNWGPVALFITMFISLLISYYRIGSHPYWFLVHLIIIIFTVFASVYLANIYYEVSLDPDLSSTFQNKLVLPATIIYRLPLIMTIFSFISIIILVTKWGKKDQEGGLPGS